jgi:hypothetical protein
MLNTIPKEILVVTLGSYGNGGNGGDSGESSPSNDSDLGTSPPTQPESSTPIFLFRSFFHGIE